MCWRVGGMSVRQTPICGSFPMKRASRQLSFCRSALERDSGMGKPALRAMAERIRWSTEARTDIRAIDRDTALRLLKGLDRFLKTGVGDVKQLEGF